MNKSKKAALQLLATTGVEINGPHPWDPQIHNERLYDRLFAEGTLGLGESYMDGWWDVDDLTELYFRAFRGGAAAKLMGIGIVWQIAKSKILNLQSYPRAFEVGEKHYDIGNDLYTHMLDKRMVYSCGYWKDAKDLEEAQERKLDLICRKIGLRASDRLLDIGCGWGGLAKFATERYGARVVGVTISKEQAAWARDYTKGLAVEIRLQDWRDIQDGPFDHIVSVGMFEHVGPKNYRPFMEKVRQLLSDNGLFLLHTIGNGKTTRNLEPWINKYIFPNGHLPSMAQISKSTDRRWFGDPIFIMEDFHNFGADYDKTLTAWFNNFEAAWPDLKEKYGERFYRMWKYYLLTSAGAFRSRNIHVWQIVYSKHGIVGGYMPIR